MLSSPVIDLTGNLEPASAGPRTAPPTRHELYCSRQPDLVICDKAIEATFCRLNDFCRIATSYDKLAPNYASALALAAVTAYWC
ncbi:hypothetical protein GMJLKIPL_1883 [Methylobacterium isbiliense]|jgi:hypothetical protein|uniref:Transposase n=1 Tax=Methylobacterium isbiliense TaxID=315478 RepID=A0ABQ4S9V0_9HYPH|nr:hypothetical protein GMJLKIPL_1883 [Methylobacterium isbiliense]